MKYEDAESEMVLCHIQYTYIKCMSCQVATLPTLKPLSEPKTYKKIYYEIPDSIFLNIKCSK